MRFIKINPSDNVAVALTDLGAGEKVEGVTLLKMSPGATKWS